MMKNPTRLIPFTVSVLLLANLSSCGVKPDPKPSPASTNLNSPPSATDVVDASDSIALNWSHVNEQVFIPNCVKCHSTTGGNKGGINLETYAHVKTLIKKIEGEAIDEQAMPPNKPLDEKAMNLLKEWIAAGSPELVSAGPVVLPTPDPASVVTPATPEPAVVPEPVVPSTPDPVLPPESGPVVVVPEPAVKIDFAYVSKRVFAVHCLSCHSVAGGEVDDVNLETYANVKSLLKKITRVAITKKSMPPRKPLPQEELDILSQWINAGAPENLPAN